MKTSKQNRYLNHLVDPSFQGVNRLFALSFEMKIIKHHIQLITRLDVPVVTLST